MTEQWLLAACGLYCGACYHYCASFPEGAHLLPVHAGHGRPGEGFACRGCRSDHLYVHPGCAECRLRACAAEKGVLHCGLCPEYPCAALLAFQSDGRVHHRFIFENLEALVALGPEQWLTQQEQRWTCRCGARFSWYEMYCRRCGALLNSYGPDPTAT